MTDTIQTNGHAGASTEPSTTSKVQPNDVGWQFVPQYYNFMNKSPNRLHCFYTKRSTFLHGEEGEEVQVALGQQEIHERIVAIGYNDCRVYINSIDSQSSAGGGVIILVIGEMQNDNGPWRKFTQTFFLAEQPGGYFVLNDIFRYLKEEDTEVEEEAEEEVDTPVAEPVKEIEPPTTYEPVVPEAEEEVIEETTPEPEPISAPADPDPETVPVEAEVAAVPDKDTAPEEPAEVEEIAETPEPAANGTESTPAPVAAPTPAPAQPSAPAKPKSWASLAAGAGKGAWGSLASASSQVGLNIGSVTAAAAAAVTPQAVKKEEPAVPTPAPAASGSSIPRHPFYENAMKVQTPHCFVKLPNWSTDNQSASETMDETTLRNVAARFGEVTKVEIVKSKACAFVEFKAVESARKAIVASLSVAQGGEGGVTVAAGQKLNFETRKEKEERRGAGGAPGAGAGAGQGAGAGGPRRGGGPEGGRGRGGRAGGPGREEGERGSGGGVNRGRGRGRGGAPQVNGQAAK